MRMKNSLAETDDMAGKMIILRRCTIYIGLNSPATAKKPREELIRRFLIHN